jgi:TonB-linked SusC/RagA family outer membrane protein
MQIIVCKLVHLLPGISNEGATPKQCLSANNGANKMLRRAVRIMNLTAILLLVGCIQIQAAGYGQTITLSERDVPIEKVFKKIQQQTEYKFLYTSQLLEGVPKVTVSVKNASVEEVLELIFKGQMLDYVVEERMIVVRPRREVKPQVTAMPGDPIDVSGKVTDGEGRPLPGANVKVRGGNNGVTTDGEGRFVLKNVFENSVLEISYVGHEMKTFTVRGAGVVNIALDQKLSLLDETVVIAYGQTTRRFATGNIASVKAADIEKQPVQNPLLALQGRVPGIEITQSSGVPGSGIIVRIRGRNSISSGNDPLFIIDGVPYVSQLLPGIGGILQTSGSNQALITGNPLSYLNPADIESIDVLKDADATAIYGSRATNGVVLITTKKGKAGAAQIKINMYKGGGKVTRRLDLLNTREYLDMRYEAFKNDGISTIPISNFDLSLWDTTRNADWQKELIGGTAHYTNLQTSISGGKENINYLISGTYFKESTVFPGNLSDQKGTLHFNLNGVSENHKLSFQLTGSYIVDKNRLIGSDLTSVATILAPVAPPLHDENDNLNWALNSSGAATWMNPLAYLQNTYRNSTSNLVSNAIISYKILSGLEIKSSFGYTNLQTDEIKTTPLTFFTPNVRAFVLRSAEYSNNNMQTWVIEPHITYALNKGKGKLESLAGATIQQNSNNGQTQYGEGFNSDLVLEDIKSAPTTRITSTTISKYKYAAIFGRLKYNWDNKYILNLTARRDGSSRFGPENRFHNFGAIGYGWIFSNERFIARYNSFLSYGKLRVSYGITGNDQLGEYRFLDLYSPTNSGVPYQGATGLLINNLYTPDLAWEETKKAEIGLEISIFKDRIYLVTSYFRNKSSNQIGGYKIPSNTGFANVTANVDATVINSGWEFVFNTTNFRSKRISWNSSFNLTIAKNKLLSIGKTAVGIDTRRIGKSLNSVFVYNLEGVDPTNGQYQFVTDQGGLTYNPTITDQYFLIDVDPKYYGGFQNSVSYKNFQFDLNFQFIKQIGKNNLFGNAIPGNRSVNQPASVLNRWQKTDDIAPVQKFSTLSFTSLYNSYFTAASSNVGYSDASFIRLKNISISYQLPDAWKKNIYIQNCRVYVQCQNLLTITSYKGLDPETKSTTSLPPLRVITAGIQFKL